MSINNSPEKLIKYSTVFEDLDILEMSISDLIVLLQQIVDDNPGFDLYAAAQDSYAWCSVNIVSQRMETDEEFNERISAVIAESVRKKQHKEMNALMKKSNLSTKEKERLITYIQESK